MQTAAFSSLKDEVMELSHRLSHVIKERDQLEKSLNRMQVASISFKCFLCISILLNGRYKSHKLL